MNPSSIWPVGVFASIDAGLGVHLPVAHELGIPTIQLHAPHRSTRTAATAREFLARLKDLNIELTAVFGGFEGESYADIPTVSRTVGLVPPSTRSVRLQEMKEISDFARELGCDVVALHLGFVPEDESHSEFAAIVETTRELCQYCRHRGQNLHLETGQETAESLIHFIDAVNTGNLYVNFDPANMILYGTGQPIAALKTLGDRVRSVHCKDAIGSARPGVEWGQEVALGNGEVNMELFLRTLNDIGYRGPLTIEREIPQDPARQKAEIGRAVSLLEQLKSRLTCSVTK